MTTPIEFLAVDNHGNVATAIAPKSFTPTLGGYGGDTIPLAAQRKSDPIDCSNYATLRLELTLASMASRYGEGDPSGATRLHVTVEHSADAGRTWEVLHAFRPREAALPGTRVVSLSAFHPLVRASWYFGDASSFARTINDAVAVTWGLAGHAVEGAAAE